MYKALRLQVRSEWVKGLAYIIHHTSQFSGWFKNNSLVPVFDSLGHLSMYSTPYSAQVTLLSLLILGHWGVCYQFGLCWHRIKCLAVGFIRTAGYIIDGSFLALDLLSFLHRSGGSWYYCWLIGTHFFTSIFHTNSTPFVASGMFKGFIWRRGIWWFSRGVPLVIVIH